MAKSQASEREVVGVSERLQVLPHWLVPALVMIAVVLSVFHGAIWGGRYDQQLLAMAGVWALLVLGYQLSFGHAGALNLAHGAFFAVGAYTSAILARTWALDFVVTGLAAMVFASGAAALVAWPVLRLKSHYFALATLAAAQLVLLVAVNWQGLTGGANGLPGVPGLTVFGMSVARGTPHLLFVWGLVAAGVIAAWRLTAGRRKLAYTAMRETPLAAGTLGIDAGRLRLQSLVAGGAFAGLAGALQVHTLRVVSPEVAQFSVLVVCLTMTVIGGRLSIAGGLVAALLLSHLPEWFRGFESYYLAANGAVLLGVVIFAPAGLIGVLEMFSRPRRQHGGAGQTGRWEIGADGPSFEVTDIVKSYGGVTALAGVTLAVSPGEITGLIGPNGSGKTTLANIVTGLDRPETGKVSLGKVDLTGRSAYMFARAGLARSFQTPELPASLSVLEAVASGTGQSAGHGGAAAWLARVGYDGDMTQMCRGLPHGARRLVEVARALSTGARFLILDEPAAGLSDSEARDLASVLKNLAAEGRGFLVIDHNMDFLMPVCGRLICLDRGRVIAAGAPRAVADDARVQAAYFGGAAG